MQHDRTEQEQHADPDGVAPLELKVFGVVQLADQKHVKQAEKHQQQGGIYAGDGRRREYIQIKTFNKPAHFGKDVLDGVRPYAAIHRCLKIYAETDEAGEDDAKKQQRIAQQPDQLTIREGKGMVRDDERRTGDRNAETDEKAGGRPQEKPLSPAEGKHKQYRQQQKFRQKLDGNIRGVIHNNLQGISEIR